MTDEELQEEQRQDFEARRDLAFTQLVCALNEGREVRKVLRGLEKEKEYSHQGSIECFGRQ